MNLKRSETISALSPSGGLECGPAANGPARRMLVLLHGSRGNAEDVMRMAPELSDALPDAVIYAPNGGLPGDPGKYQHFEIVQHYEAAQFGKAPQEWSSDETTRMRRIGHELRRFARPADRLFGGLLKHAGVAAKDTALLGFSQGGQMALHLGLRRREQLGAAVSMSGTLLEPDALPTMIASRPPVLLTHGDADTVLPLRAQTLARDVLAAAGVPVETHVVPGAGHHGEWIQALPAVRNFLSRKLSRTVA